MPSISTLAWIAGCAIILMVILRFLHDMKKKSDAEAARQIAERDAKWLAEARERKSAWDAFEADIAARQTALEENPTCPEYVISQLVGEDYPRFSVFMRVIETARYQQPYFANHDDGERYPSSMPPEAPEIVETYDRLTEASFDSFKDAKLWFDLWIDPATRQTAIDVTEDDTLRVKHFWGEMDAEAEANV